MLAAWTSDSVSPARPVPTEIGLAQFFRVAGEFAAGGGLDGGNDGQQGVVRGLLLRAHFVLHGAGAGELAEFRLGGVGQGGDLRGQRGVEIHGGERGGVGGVNGGGGHGAGIFDFVQVFAVDGAAGALGFCLGRGPGCWSWISHKFFGVEGRFIFGDAQSVIRQSLAGRF